MKIWVLGGNGMVATSVTAFLKRKGIDFVASSKEAVDITSFDSLEKGFQLIGPSHVINCAAYTRVDDAETKRELAMSVNAEGPGILGRLARIYGSRVIHISTDYVFAGKEHRPFKEADPTCPINYYGITKAAGEQALLKELPSACIVRTSWVYGMGGKSFISSIVRLLQTEKVLHVVDDQIGRPTFCNDLVEALYELRDSSGIYHFASGGAGSRYEIACAVFSFMKKHNLPLLCTEIIPVSSSTALSLAPRPLYSVLDTAKYEREFHKKPRGWIDTLGELFS
jgi:dTDP-4-dehydrorhamnose reductase